MVMRGNVTSVAFRLRGNYALKSHIIEFCVVVIYLPLGPSSWTIFQVGHVGGSGFSPSGSAEGAAWSRFEASRCM